MFPRCLGESAPEKLSIVETVGAGLFADLLADKAHRHTAAEGNEGGWQRLGRLLEHSDEIAWTIEVDGGDFSRTTSPSRR